MTSVETNIPVSNGEAGTLEQRSFNRLYLTEGRTLRTIDEFWQAYQGFEAQTSNLNQSSRRHVFRSIVSREIVAEILKYEWGSGDPLAPGTHLEMVLELQQLVPTNQSDDRYLVMISTNHHPSDLSNAESSTATDFIRASGNRDIHEPLSNIELLLSGYRLTNTLSASDCDQLYALWGNTFGWERKQVANFIYSYRTSPKFYFCGVRNERDQLVAASMAESVVLGDLLLVELTEWASHAPRTATKMISGLIAQVLERSYYQIRGQEARLPIIIAEMNLHRLEGRSGSPAAGIKAGLTFPNTLQVATGVPQTILRHNVMVDQGRPTTETSNFLHEQTINNFIIGWLTLATVSEFYPPGIVASIIQIIESESYASYL